MEPGELSEEELEGVMGGPFAFNKMLLQEQIDNLTKKLHDPDLSKEERTRIMIIIEELEAQIEQLSKQRRM